MNDYTLRVDAGLFCNVTATSEDEARRLAAQFFEDAVDGFAVSGLSLDGKLLTVERDARVYANDCARVTVEDVEPKVTDQEFDRILTGIVGDLGAATLLGIPGVYEILSEHFNNEVLEQWKEEREEAAG